MNKKWVRRLLSLLGLLILGALGSGLWEMAFRPAGQWLLKSSLALVTLGSTTLRNHIYAEAAKGSHEAASQYLLTLYLSAIIWLPVVFLFLAVLLHRRLNNLVSEYSLFRNRDLEPDKVGEKDSTKVGAGINGRIRKARILIAVAYCMVGILFIQSGYMSASMLRVCAASDVSTYFSQSLNICRPYISQQESDMMSSKFARIQSKKDFEAVISELRQIASSNHIVLPPDVPQW